MKYKYAIKSGKNIKLCNDYDSIHCASETLIENPFYKILNGNLVLLGNEIQYRLNRFEDSDIKLEDVEEKYIKTYKTWLGFGKEKRKVKSGWVILKKRIPVRYTLSHFELYE